MDDVGYFDKWMLSSTFWVNDHGDFDFVLYFVNLELQYHIMFGAYKTNGRMLFLQNWDLAEILR